MAAPATRRSSRNDPRVWRFVLFTWLGMVLMIPVGMLGEAMTDIGPASTAHNGQGLPGIYHVTDSHCGAKGCFVFGDFTASGQSTPSLTAVSIQSDSSLSTGQNVAAVEVSGNVYPAGGGSAWSRDLWFFALAPLGLAAWGGGRGRQAA